MPKDGKHRFSEKEHREAMHIKASYLKRGLSEEEAARRAWATVNAGKKIGLGSLRGKGKHR